MAAAVCYRPDGSDATLAFRLRAGAYNDKSLIGLLEELHRHLNGDKVTLIWDGLPSHRSKRMNAWVASQRRWLVVERLPAYGHEPNRSNRCWATSRAGLIIKERDYFDTVSSPCQVGRVSVDRVAPRRRTDLRRLRRLPVEPASSVVNVIGGFRPYDSGVTAMLCPVVVGRDAQLQRLTARLEEAAGGRGGVLGLLGEAGTGKSRLVREARAEAHARGLLVLTGRAVARATPTPLRPLAEAVQSGFRDAEPPGEPSLAPFLPALAQLHPGWSAAGAAPGTGIVLAEALVRLLSSAGRGRGCLLELEDLHWADPDTLEILGYLADHLDDAPVLVLASARSAEGTAGERVLRAIAQRQAAELLETARLGPADVEAMVAACLGADVDRHVTELVEGRAEGVPLFVEELLAAFVGMGALRADEGVWRVVGRLDASGAVPTTFAETVESRLAAMPPPARDVLAAAAALGRRFDWRLLPAATELAEPRVLDALHDAVAVQLLEAQGDGFRFRHALGRDVVLAGLLPPARAEVARRCLSALEQAHPNLPDEWCEVAAGLAVQAGDVAGAVGLLLESARRALRHGAVRSAAQTADRARELAGGDAQLRLAVDEAAGEAAAFAGDLDTATALLGEVLAALARTASNVGRRARLHLALARAAVAAGRWTVAEHHVDAGTALAGAQGDRGALAEALALGSQVALAQDRLADAERLAREAVAHGEAGGAPGAVCEAHEVLGRCARLHDLEIAEEHFQAARRTAEAHGLRLWRARALHELGTIDLFTTLRTDRLEEARQAAVDAGAVSTVALADLHLTSVALAHWRAADAFEAINRCLALARPLRLDTCGMALIHLACAHAAVGDEPAMEAAVAEALDVAGDSLDVVAGVPGRARSMLALRRGDFVAARRYLEEAVDLLRRAPRFFPFLGVWALLATVQDERSGQQARAHAAAAPGASYDVITWHLALGEAVDLGRAGRRVEAEKLWAERMVNPPPVTRLGPWLAIAQLVVAGPAARDGWGDPERWLRAAHADFQERDMTELASACRAALRDIGAPAPRPTRAAADVPAALREHGVTPREAEVLELVRQGMTNREIGARLHLSPRTVDRHVASLLAKTGAADRRALSRMAGA